MFDGVPDQFHQFIAQSRTSLPIPLSFPPIHGSSPTFPNFDPYPPHQQTLPSHLLHQLHHHPSPGIPTNKDEKEEENSITILSSTSLELETERSISDPWSNEEVLELLKIRSSRENWFPDLTWDHVSRKLGELGYKRSAEKCKEKFEEETSNFSSISYNKNNNRFFSELEELYHHDGEKPNPPAEKDQITEKPRAEEDKMGGQGVEEESINVAVHAKSPAHQESDQQVARNSRKIKKRKRDQKFEMFKSFCEDIVNKMMAQQEELHNKLLEDMLNRDEQKIAREEAWKRQEMERMTKEIEFRAHEKVTAGDRQTTIIEFLKNFTSNSSENLSFGLANFEDRLKVPTSLTSPSTSPSCQLTSVSPVHNASTTSPSRWLNSQNSANPPSSLFEGVRLPNPSSTLTTNLYSKPPTSQNPISSTIQDNPLSPTSSSAQKAQKYPKHEREDTGKRWPKDEVLALINMRCSSEREDKEGSAKGSLWERISQGMLELGYQRSAKRCKEKWENINKYFRKTKDVNKKRSVDSRTCPYFHQLSTLYNEGKLPPADRPENCPSLPENRSAAPESSLGSGSRDANLHVGDGGKNAEI
ncbi:hypothetical protein RJ640_027858 [Escallonia rubra]|uniref:Myb-like domain-containing protein n=1 Tax=Escallonia rubra TaxID=112253 RepID=A0AA88SJH0_9ASTE|nr:hypothetical protein RJ640_027858 [Escallonia rubra]